jgi:hypothetical protein
VLFFIIHLGSSHGSYYYVGERPIQERSSITLVRMRNVYEGLDRNGKNETTWETFVQMDFKEIILGRLEWVCLCQDAQS